MVNKVYYININYLCDNKCIFCYSHNTNNLKNSNFSLKRLEELFKKYKISSNDRVILNGGEPLLHKEIDGILNFLHKKCVEILIFTNGRNIRKLNPKYLNNKIRFIVPIHGSRDIHNYITGDKKSFDETMDSLNWLFYNNFNCLVDMKIILNEKTIEKEGFEKSLEIWKKIPFNNAIHITKMMETKVSKINNCKKLDDKKIKKYNLKLFNEFKELKKIKFYSTCIYEVLNLKNYEIIENQFQVKLLYVDYQSEKYIKLKKNTKECERKCEYSTFCFSETEQYNVLEIFQNKILKNME